MREQLKALIAKLRSVMRADDAWSQGYAAACDHVADELEAALSPLPAEGQAAQEAHRLAREAEIDRLRGELDRLRTKQAEGERELFGVEGQAEARATVCPCGFGKEHWHMSGWCWQGYKTRAAEGAGEPT